MERWIHHRVDIRWLQWLQIFMTAVSDFHGFNTKNTFLEKKLFSYILWFQQNQNWRSLFFKFQLGSNKNQFKLNEVQLFYFFYSISKYFSTKTQRKKIGFIINVFILTLTHHHQRSSTTTPTTILTNTHITTR